MPTLINTFCKVQVSFVLSFACWNFWNMLPVLKLKHINLKNYWSNTKSVIVSSWICGIGFHLFPHFWLRFTAMCFFPMLFASQWRCIKSSQLFVCSLFLPCLILQLIDAGMFLELEHFDYIIKLLHQLQVSSWEMTTVLNIKSRYVFKELFSNYSCLVPSSVSIFINLCGIFKRYIGWKYYHIMPKCCQSTVFERLLNQNLDSDHNY